MVGRIEGTKYEGKCRDSVKIHFICILGNKPLLTHMRADTQGKNIKVINKIKETGTSGKTLLLSKRYGTVFLVVEMYENSTFLTYYCLS